MNRKIKTFIICLLFCLPMYPLVMFAEWHSKRGYSYSSFSLLEETKEYWLDVYNIIFWRY